VKLRAIHAFRFGSVWWIGETGILASIYTSNAIGPILLKLPRPSIHKRDELLCWAVLLVHSCVFSGSAIAEGYGGGGAFCWILRTCREGGCPGPPAVRLACVDPGVLCFVEVRRDPFDWELNPPPTLFHINIKQFGKESADFNEHLAALWNQ